MPNYLVQDPELHIATMEEIDYEIMQAGRDGYEVTRGETVDPAYEKPEHIRQIRFDIDDLGERYAFLSRSRTSKLPMAAAALQQSADRHTLPLPASFRRAAKKRDAELEFIRAELLFDETKMPWHLQRGRAPALQTIDNAHNLIAIDGPNAGEGIYPTMGGELTIDPETFRFSDNDGVLAGKTIREAFIEQQQRLDGKSLEQATKSADRAIVNFSKFLKAPVTQDFKNIVAYSQDSLGIRNRKQEVRNAVAEHINRIVEADPDKKTLTLLSVGCGTALSILEVAQDALARGLTPTIILLDQDPIALAAARNLAEQRGLGDYIEIHCEKLFDQKGQPFNIETILAGRKVDIAEDTGLREYLPDRVYKNLSKTIWNNLSENGMITTGNMNSSRPQPEFLHGLMGWNPRVQMRTIEQGFALHEASGIPKGSTKARVTHDAVYTLFYSYIQPTTE